jgi:hypothetical protein
MPRHRPWAALPALALSGAMVLVACSGDEGSAEELCAAVRDDPTLTSTFTGFDPTDTDHALEQLRAARVSLGELRDAAPAEVRDDLTVEIDYVQALLEGIEGLDGRDSAETVAVVQQITSEHPDVDDAAASLAAFAAESCGSAG